MTFRKERKEAKRAETLRGNVFPRNGHASDLRLPPLPLLPVCRGLLRPKEAPPPGFVHVTDAANSSASMARFTDE